MKPEKRPRKPARRIPRRSPKTLHKIPKRKMNQRYDRMKNQAPQKLTVTQKDVIFPARQSENTYTSEASDPTHEESTLRQKGRKDAEYNGV